MIARGGTSAARRLAVSACALLAGGWAEWAVAQTITGVLPVRNAGNSADGFSAGNPSYERESQVVITAATATSFTSRYSALASADSGLFGAARLEVLNADDTISFSVIAPEAYRLTVAGRRTGDLHLIEDNIFVADHYADMTALSGSFGGGTLTGGSLSLSDPGRANDIPFVFDPIFVAFDQASSATITGVSNGAAMAHSPTYTWSQEAFSPGAVAPAGPRPC